MKSPSKFKIESNLAIAQKMNYLLKLDKILFAVRVKETEKPIRIEEKPIRIEEKPTIPCEKLIIPTSVIPSQPVNEPPPAIPLIREEPKLPETHVPIKKYYGRKRDGQNSSSEDDLSYDEIDSTEKTK